MLPPRVESVQSEDRRMKATAWSRYELLLLRVVYTTGVFSPDELDELFPGRTLQSIRTKASRLGYHRGRPEETAEIFERIATDPKIALLDPEGREVVEVRRGFAQRSLVDVQGSVAKRRVVG